MLSWSYNQIKDDDVENDESMRSGIWNCLSFRCQRLKNFISRTFQFDLLKTDLEVEMMGGLIQFLSTMYCLPVIPSQMATAGYDRHFTFASISLCIAVSSILFSYCSNLPFIIAPPTSISIYLVAAQLDLGLSRTESNTAVVYSGMALLIVGLVKPISQLVSKLIPACIQASTAVGIGLITAFAGAIDLKLVVRGEYTVVTMGTATKDVYFALIAAVVIAMALNYHFKFSFVLGLMVGTLLSWSFDMDFPQAIVSYPEFDRGDVNMDFNNPKIIYLVCNLLFLYILLLNGLARGLADLAQLTQADGSILRGNWIFVICGIGTILSGYLSGPPLLISPESAAGIKAGSKTGFSTLICGLMYMLSIFLSPIFSTVPPAGTSPLMVFVGMLLFQNISRIDWHDHISCVPAFFVLLLIPFTYSIIGGVGAGYALYIPMSILSGQMHVNSQALIKYYWPSQSTLYEHSDDGHYPNEGSSHIGLHLSENSFNVLPSFDEPTKVRRHSTGAEIELADDEFYVSDSDGETDGEKNQLYHETPPMLNMLDGQQVRLQADFDTAAIDIPLRDIAVKNYVQPSRDEDRHHYQAVNAKDESSLSPYTVGFATEEGLQGAQNHAYSDKLSEATDSSVTRTFKSNSLHNIGRVKSSELSMKSPNTISLKLSPRSRTKSKRANYRSQWSRSHSVGCGDDEEGAYDRQMSLLPEAVRVEHERNREASRSGLPIRGDNLRRRQGRLGAIYRMIQLYMDMNNGDIKSLDI